MNLIINLTQEEGAALLNLIDQAVQAKGLSAAETGLHFFKKIQAAYATLKVENVGGEQCQQETASS